MGSRHAIAVHLGRRRLCGVWATRPPQRPAEGETGIRGVLAQTAPESLDWDDAAAVGHWIAACFKDAGFPKAKLVVGLAREVVGLKRITLPTLDDGELPSMTRLAMQRDLPFEPDSAVIDFVPVQRDATSTTVLAVAAPLQAIDFCHAWAKAAGLGIERITLRSMGMAALIAQSADHRESTGDAGARHGGSTTLGIDIASDMVEFCIIAEGSLQFSRAAEVPPPRDALSVADAVVTETRRTWMSYLATSGSPTLRAASAGGAGPESRPPGLGISRAVLMGDRRIAEYAARPVAQMLRTAAAGAAADVLAAHPLINLGEANDSAIELDEGWSLAGLLIEPLVNGAVLDLSRPRQPPNLAAARYRRWLLAAVFAMAAGALAISFGARNLSTLRAAEAKIAAAKSELTKPHTRYLRDSFKLTHLRQWESLSADWLGHAAQVAHIAPPTDQLVLDSWVGAQESRAISYNRTTGKWSTYSDIIIVLDGEARDRETADRFREALVQESMYSTSTTGTDTQRTSGGGGKRMPVGFTYRLRTNQLKTLRHETADERR